MKHQDLVSLKGNSKKNMYHQLQFLFNGTLKVNSNPVSAGWTERFF